MRAEESLKLKLYDVGWPRGYLSPDGSIARVGYSLIWRKPVWEPFAIKPRVLKSWKRLPIAKVIRPEQTQIKILATIEQTEPVGGSMAGLSEQLDFLGRPIPQGIIAPTETWLNVEEVRSFDTLVEHDGVRWAINHVALTFIDDVMFRRVPYLDETEYESSRGY